MINTVLYDMDGLLLDTEPLWGESMLRIAQKHNIEITRERFKETRGLRIYEVTEYWSRKYPWQGKDYLGVADEILDDIIALSKLRGSVLTGVENSLKMFKENGFKIGLASSSPSRMINALVEHFSIHHYFDCITSADAVELGKPNPAVFLHCAESLNSSPRECVVLEDSINGMIAGLAARMKVIVVPEALHFNDPGFSLANAKLKNLNDLDIDLIKRLS